MRVSRTVLSFCFFLGLASQSIVPAETEVGKYEVLGLRLGMTAKEAENVITAFNDLHPRSCYAEPRDTKAYERGLQLAAKPEQTTSLNGYNLERPEISDIQRGAVESFSVGSM